MERLESLLAQGVSYRCPSPRELGSGTLIYSKQKLGRKGGLPVDSESEWLKKIRNTSLELSRSPAGTVIGRDYAAMQRSQNNKLLDNSFR